MASPLFYFIIRRNRPLDIGLIALDMDGTLLGADHATIPQRNLDALREAARRGVSIAIASGRSWSLIRETARDLGVTHYGITANGALVLDAATHDVLVKTPMDVGQCVKIIQILRRHALAYELYVDGENYVQRSDTDFLLKYALSDSFSAMFERNVTLVDDMLEAIQGKQPEKFDIFYVPPQVYPAVMADLRTTGELAYTGALGNNLELTAACVNKGAALSALSAKLGLRADQVMAFGDADNDVEMLAWAGWSFAMENGDQLVKDTAKYLTGPNHQGGVGMAVERYVLGQ